MLADREVDSLNEGRIDLPPLCGQDVLDLRKGAEDDPMLHANQAPPAVLFDHLDFLPFVKAKEEAFSLSMSTACLQLGS
jgi:hypothetical protein